MSKHSQASGNGNGNGGVPDWFYWSLAFIVLVIVLLIFVLR